MTSTPTSTPPEIPALSSQTSVEVRRAFDLVRGWFRSLAKQGGVTVNPPPDPVRISSSEFAVPQAITGLQVLYTYGGVVVTWDAPTYSNYSYTEVWRSEIDNLGEALLIADTKTGMYTDTQPLAYPGTVYYYWVRPITTVGVAGAFNDTDGTTDAVLVPPRDVATFSVYANKGMIDVVWTANTDVDLAGYEIRLGPTWESGDVIITKAAGTRFSWQPTSTGNQQFWIKAIDTAGNYSNNAKTAILTIDGPVVSNLSQQVIDNNVLLSWEMTQGTYLIDYVEIRRGISFDTAGVIGRLAGTFTALFETAAGTYKYWVVARDIAGLYGEPAGLYAVVNQPPDYVLYDQYTLALTGTISNCVVDATSLFAPVPPQTYENHFIANGWSTPQAQVDAGYPIFIQPGVATGSYKEIIDYGTTIPGTKIVLAVTKNEFLGAVTITPTIETSTTGAFAGEQTIYAGVYEIYATSFRYLRITLDFATSDGGIVEIVSAVVRMDVKMKSVQGKILANAADSGGTVVNITGDFIDVQSISLTPASTSAVFAVYDFVDVPYPDEFKILVFNTAGTRVSALVSYTIRGV